MIDILSQYKRKANKEHRCNFCGGKIDKGKEYFIQRIKGDMLYTWKWHIECDKFTTDYSKHFIDCDDGIDANSFHNAVYEELYERYGEDKASDLWHVETMFNLVKLILGINCV